MNRMLKQHAPFSTKTTRDRPCDVHGCTSVAEGRIPETTATRPSLHGGFTLLEVLVAIVVLSIGLLGLAGLQAAGLRNNQGAYLRTIATQQAYDMADRIRANPAAAAAIGGPYDNINTTDAGSNNICISSVGGCTPAQVAQYDIYDWQTTNQNVLPAGKGRVTRAAANRFTITIMWDDARTGATGIACGANPAVDLTCFSVSIQP